MGGPVMTLPTLKQLHYFVTIVDEGGISRAAARLLIAQPAISEQISGLEVLLGAKLLTRSARGTKPTDAGLVLYRQASSIMRQIEQLSALVASADLEPAGLVGIGLISSLAARLSDSLLSTCHIRYPKIRLRIVEGTSVDIREQVMAGRIDLGLAFGDSEVPGLVRRPLFRQKLFVVGAPHLLADDSAPGISTSELAHHALVMPSAPNAIRMTLDRSFARLGLSPNVVAETTSLHGLLAAVTAGLGLTVLPVGEPLPPSNADGLVRRELMPSLHLQAALLSSALTPPGSAALAVQGVLAEIIVSRVSQNVWVGSELD